MKNIVVIIKQNYKLVVGILIIGVLIGFLTGRLSSHPQISTSPNSQISTSSHQIWTCSMHPQIRMDHPGKCPICGMDLIPLKNNTNQEAAVSPNEIQMTDAAMKIANIQTMVVHKAYPDKKVYLLGKIQPDERNIAELTARFSGRIEKLYVNFTGQRMAKGDKLATIYSPQLITAQKELLEAEEYKQSNPDFYKAARNKLKLWDLTDEQINNIETKGEAQTSFDILSPIEGTVTQRNVTPGDYVKEGNSLFEVIDLTKVWVMFEAYENDLQWIKVGDKVDFTTQSLPGKNFSGHVGFIDPVIDPKTRIARVRVEVPNPGLVLKPEMFVNGLAVSSVAGNHKDLMIPKTAVLWTGKRAVVYVKVPGHEQQPTFAYREIVLGPEAGDFYVVAGGLQEDEEIAVNGVFKIDAAAQLAGKPSMMNPQGGNPGAGEMPGMKMITPAKHNEPKAISENMSAMKQKPEAKTQQTTFRVSGNCDMCKARIEKAAKSVSGVDSTDWNIKTKMLHLIFDPGKTSQDDVQKVIAMAGHDTGKYKAPDSVYNSLPECCRYRK